MRGRKGRRRKAKVESKSKRGERKGRECLDRLSPPLLSLSFLLLFFSLFPPLLPLFFPFTLPLSPLLIPFFPSFFLFSSHLSPLLYSSLLPFSLHSWLSFFHFSSLFLPLSSFFFSLSSSLLSSLKVCLDEDCLFKQSCSVFRRSSHLNSVDLDRACSPGASESWHSTSFEACRYSALR